MNTALVVMAAGIGSRFGGGIKQLEPMGPNGEIIMDYSIYDALEAGFNKVVFIIRHDLEEDFKEIIGKRIEKLCPVEYVFQELSDVPEGFTVNPERKKPLGTGQAILACRGVVKEPFAVINADDYYGKNAFKIIHDGLVSEDFGKDSFCMGGYVLANTLSDNGGVSRGVCSADADSYLTGVTETHNIMKTEDGAAVKQADGTLVPIDPESKVSMNLWGLAPEFISYLGEEFKTFLANLAPDDIKSEYLLPTIINDAIQKGDVKVKLLPVYDKWFGVTYKEDKPVVVESFKKLIADGVYPEKLFN